jgi:hypothetical protein
MIVSSAHQKAAKCAEESEPFDPRGRDGSHSGYIC